MQYEMSLLTNGKIIYKVCGFKSPEPEKEGHVALRVGTYERAGDDEIVTHLTVQEAKKLLCMLEEAIEGIGSMPWDVRKFPVSEVRTQRSNSNPQANVMLCSS